jgi:hypothetical protein
MIHAVCEQPLVDAANKVKDVLSLSAFWCIECNKYVHPNQVLDGTEEHIPYLGEDNG